MSIFNKIDYRENIRTLVNNRKKFDSSVTFQKMAKAMRIQKAYLSQVLNGSRDFNQDQLHMACEYLDLKEHEREYLKLLVEYERSGLADRRRILKAEIKKMQKTYSKTSAHIDVDEVVRAPNRDDYYLDPFNQIVHQCLDIEKYQSQPLELAKVLFVPVERVKKSLMALERMGIIRFENGKVIDEAVAIHLPKDSPLFQSWKSNLNQLAQNRIKHIGDNKTYNFSAVFGADEEVRSELESEFMKFISKAKKISEKTKVKEVYQMNFDLFSWTEDY